MSLQARRTTSKNLFIASTHDYVLFFTNTGQRLPQEGLPHPGGRAHGASGTNIVNILPLEQGERVHGHAADPRIRRTTKYLIMVTRDGTVKRMPARAPSYTARKAGIRALSLDDGDELIAVVQDERAATMFSLRRSDGHGHLLRRDGRAPHGPRRSRRARHPPAATATMSSARRVADEGKSLLTVTENGYGKRTAVEAYLRGEDRQPQTRGGKGLRNYRLTEKTGLVAGAAIVDDTNDVMLIESGGVVLRTPAASINLYGRDTQGVILMRIEEGNRVIGVEAISNTEETEESGED